MEILSRRLGKIEVPDGSLIVFPRGLVGLPQRQRFVIVEFGNAIPLGWLQSVEDPDFGLPVAEPAIYTGDYQVEIEKSEISELGLADESDAAILVVTTIVSGGPTITGNLRAPLIVNARNRIGKQIILERPDFELRACVDPLRFARAISERESRSHRGEDQRPTELPTREDPKGVFAP